MPANVGGSSGFRGSGAHAGRNWSEVDVSGRERSEPGVCSPAAAGGWLARASALWPRALDGIQAYWGPLQQSNEQWPRGANPPHQGRHRTRGGGGVAGGRAAAGIVSGGGTGTARVRCRIGPGHRSEAGRYAFMDRQLRPRVGMEGGVVPFGHFAVVRATNVVRVNGRSMRDQLPA